MTTFSLQNGYCGGRIYLIGDDERGNTIYLVSIDKNEIKLCDDANNSVGRSTGLSFTADNGRLEYD